MASFFRELWHFFLANARASYFGAFMLAVFLVTEVVSIPGVSRYDVIFLAAITYQILALVSGVEKPREFGVIFLFHVLATGMELFKTNPSIGSWTYPTAQGTIFVLYTVPLFSGFLYSSVGSYISRAFVFLNLAFERFPRYYHLWILAILIYLNFFTHHFVFDIRNFLFAYALVLFARTSISFQVYRARRRMPFLLAAFFTAFFVWIAENIGTATQIWLYPSQLVQWHPVSLSKLGSWFLLLILSFALVSIVNKDKIRSPKSPV